jgi:Transposase DDE domain./Transposase domain (DUF772).
MYKKHLQFSIEDFYFPYGKLSPENRWVKIADVIDWDVIEDDYARKFVNNGAPAHPARMALGSLIAKQMLGCSDEELTLQIAENPYLQFLIGLKSFEESCPFGASTLVAFRKRFSEDDIMRINESIIKGGKDDDESDDEGNGEAGTLILDATVAPSDITYPQDIKLLNAAREKLEAMIGMLCAQTGAQKPRMYKKTARKDFLNWSKAKRRSAKSTRRGLRKQLNYVRRDLGYVEELLEVHNAELDDRQTELLHTISCVYEQQSYMFENKCHSVPKRIVSICQPWVRPIVRGKTNANTEFGAKMHISIADGFARLEDLSFEAFNEADFLISAAETHKERTGEYPTRILADKIYRNRKNLAWCKERGIAISGPRLGRPPKDKTLTRMEKIQEYQDVCDRNEVEGAFGTMKCAYGIDPVKARLEETTKTVIALAVLAFNLKKRLKVSLAFILEWLYRTILANEDRVVIAA